MTETAPKPERLDAGSPSRTAIRLALVIALVVIVGLRLAATRTESINWDEFTLFHNASWTATSGELHAGGRPGLAVLVLLPFVSECANEIDVIRSARVLWLFFSFACLAGLAILLVQLRPQARHRWRDALLGVLFLAAVPSWIVWSLQVRTDQIALAGAIWGAVALLASRRHPPLAIVAGALFGLGILSSQKAIYVGGLAGLCVLGDLWRERELSFTRESLRGLMCLSALGMVTVGFYALVPHLLSGEPATPEVVSNAVAKIAPKSASANVRFQMDVFDYYRQSIGFSQYREMLPELVPQIVMLLLMMAATAGRFAQGRLLGRSLLLAWSMLALGVFVCIFHAGAFKYFWMTLGLFPAVAFVLAKDSVLELISPLSPALRRVLIGCFLALLIVPGAIELNRMLRDTQAVQRESLDFAHRNFSERDTGFHAEAGLFCQADPARFRPYFSHRINTIFGPAAQCMTCAPDFVQEFFDKQVKFLVTSYRLNQFPPYVRQFWESNYLPYRGAVMVAGKRFREGEEVDQIQLVVDGDYYWLPNEPPASIVIDGTEFATGARVRLDRGLHDVQFPDGTTPGRLVLAMTEPPQPPLKPFYKN